MWLTWLVVQLTQQLVWRCTQIEGLGQLPCMSVKSSMSTNLLLTCYTNELCFSLLSVPTHFPKEMGTCSSSLKRIEKNHWASQICVRLWDFQHETCLSLKALQAYCSRCLGPTLNCLVLAVKVFSVSTRAFCFWVKEYVIGFKTCSLEAL